MSINYDFTIVGAGVVGLATAYKLQLKFPEKSILILEKESDVGMHQTGRNSGVIHSGIYYKPGSYKAKNCKEGRTQLVQYCKKFNVPHDICGKLIVATKNEELSGLETIFETGKINGTEGIRYVNSEEIEAIEPFIKGIKAIHVPTAGIVDYVALCKSFITEIQNINTNSTCLFDTSYKGIQKNQNGFGLFTSQGEYQTKKVIYCAGLQSDRLAEQDDLKLDMKIVGFRGDYYEFTPEAQHKINHLVYPVPDPNFPFLGVHFTRMIDGSIECGPNAVFTFKREGYKRTSFSWKDSYEALKFIGTWRLFGKHWRKGIDEYRRAFSKVLFVKELRKMMPEIEMNDVVATRSGVRAQAIDARGNMINDFKIVEKDSNIHILNAPSPAATSCLAIADEVVKMID